MIEYNNEWERIFEEYKKLARGPFQGN